MKDAQQRLRDSDETESQTISCYQNGEACRGYQFLFDRLLAKQKARQHPHKKNAMMVYPHHGEL